MGGCDAATREAMPALEVAALRIFRGPAERVGEGGGGVGIWRVRRGVHEWGGDGRGPGVLKTRNSGDLIRASQLFRISAFQIL
jgi:hypothetical protein